MTARCVVSALRAGLCLFAISAVSACASGPGAHGTRWDSPNGLYKSGPVGSRAASDYRAPSGAGGVQKIGRPYQVNGVWYVPARQDDYRETGIASWYGPQFHGRPTANGETFDMNLVSAAHTTLPLPCLVRVTNRENGRSLVIRVNDRGPFVDDRIIDLSKAAAEQLGFVRQGTARVTVEYVGPAGVGTYVERAPSRAAARPRVASRSRGAVLTPASAAPARLEAAPAVERALGAAERAASGSVAPSYAAAAATAFSPGLYVQVATMSSQGRADAVIDTLGGGGPVFVRPVDISGRTLYRVMVGPWPGAGEADEARRAIARLGFEDARIVDTR